MVAQLYCPFSITFLTFQYTSLQKIASFWCAETHVGIHNYLRLSSHDMILKCSKGHTRSLRPGLGKNTFLQVLHLFAFSSVFFSKPRCWGCSGWTGKLVWLDLSNLFQYGAIDGFTWSGWNCQVVKDQWIQSPKNHLQDTLLGSNFWVSCHAAWGCIRAVRLLRFKLAGWGTDQIWTNIVLAHPIYEKSCHSHAFCKAKH